MSKKSQEFKPMLAVEAKLDQITYPVMASPKIDGIRCVIKEGVPLTRSLKPIPNVYVRQTLQAMHLPAFDGELVVGDSFNETSSAIMSHSGSPEFKFMVFDIWANPSHEKGLEWGLTTPFKERFELAESLCFQHSHVTGQTAARPLFHEEIDNRAELDEFYEHCLDKGHEGIMIRDPEGVYKFGRSTLKERGLLKLKPFEDAEAVIIGFIEKEHNENPATINALGHTERSTKKEGKTPAGTLGTLVVRGTEGKWDGIEFEIGTGFNDSLRRKIWDDRPGHLGSVVKFKYQDFGSIDRPRLPVFLGFRSDLDRIDSPL